MWFPEIKIWHIVLTIAVVMFIGYWIGNGIGSLLSHVSIKWI